MVPPGSHEEWVCSLFPSLTQVVVVPSLMLATSWLVLLNPGYSWSLQAGWEQLYELTHNID